jgi:hypothetical protein
LKKEKKLNLDDRNLDGREEAAQNAFANKNLNLKDRNLQRKTVILANEMPTTESPL